MVYLANTGEQALNIVTQRKPEVILLDIRLSGGVDRYEGIDLLQEIKKFYPSAKVIMVTAIENPEIIAKAMGSFLPCLKPHSLSP